MRLKDSTNRLIVDPKLGVSPKRARSLYRSSTISDERANFKRLVRAELNMANPVDDTDLQKI